MSSEKKNTNITITIDTKNINISNLESTVIFSDDRGGNEGSENPPDSTDYYSLVNKGKNVIWTALVDPKSHDPGDSVSLLSVFINPYNEGGSLLKDEAYIAEASGTITGKIKKDPAKKNGTYPDENYYIVFIVNKDNDSNPSNIYTIDPKLRIQSG